MKYILSIILALCMAALLCACGAGEALVEEASLTTVAEPWRDEYTKPTGALTVPYGFNGWDQRQPLLIAEDEANNLYLYGLPGPGGVVLIWEDEASSYSTGYSAWFDWSFRTPHQDMPEMTVLDSNGNKMVVAIKTHAVTGTGVSVYDLHVAEIIPRKYQWTDDWEKIWEDASFDDFDYVFIEGHRFEPEDIQAQIDAVVTWQASGMDDYDTATLTLNDGKQKITGQASMGLLPGSSELDGKPLYTGIINFTVDETGIRLESHVGVCSVTANVHYKDGKFTLTDIALKPNKN